jgi:hypothetical protein
LPLCPKGVHVAAWHKPHGVQATTRGMHNVWEPVIVWPARELRPGIPDALRALPARGGGDLIGRKPLKFCGWLFGLLGALPGDEFHDLFPGSGIVARAWSAYVSPEYSADASSAAAGDTCLPAPDDTSARATSDACAEVLGDASRTAPSDASADGKSDASPRGISDTCHRYRDDACPEYFGDG